MRLNMTTGRRFLFGSAMLAATLAALIASPAVAAPGDLLATVNLPGNGTCNVTGTLACTDFGTHYFAIDGNGCQSTTIGVYAPCAGAVCNATAVATKTVPNVLSGLTYDPSRSTDTNVVLWGMHASSLYRIDLGDPTVSGAAAQTLVCNTTIGGLTLIDGLAYDASDDTLYASPDVDLSVYQLSLGGDNGPPCTLMKTVSPQNAGGVTDGLVSGVAIGSDNTLYIGRNGAAEIRLVDKTTGAFISNFSTTAGRVEGLTCDPKTYAPLEAVLAKDAYGALYEAFEVEEGTCPLVGDLLADIDIKFCSNPNGFNCKSGGVMPMTVFGGGALDVHEIDLDTVQLCLADDDSVCIDAESLRNANYFDRGNPDDVGAFECTINEETGEEEYFLNPDGLDDLELAWEKQDVVDTLFDDCDGFDKGEASPTLIFKAETYDGIAIRSVPLGDPGIDQVWRQK